MRGRITVLHKDITFMLNQNWDKSFIKVANWESNM